jgi:two-component system, chemotaxis family, sensor histidine kinase and response regulator WspE
VNKRRPDNPRELSMQELFRVEAENQTALLTSGLLELERAPAAPAQLESLMRAAHSLKGAARIVNLLPAVNIAHAMEDCFVAAQQGRLTLVQGHIDALLRGADWLAAVAQHDVISIRHWQAEFGADCEAWLKTLQTFVAPPDSAPAPTLAIATAAGTSLAPPSEIKPAIAAKSEDGDRVLHLTAENLNRLLGLAGEALVESRWLRPFAESLQRLKRMQTDLERTLEGLRQSFDGEKLSEPTREKVGGLFQQVTEAQHYLHARLLELDLYDRRAANLSNRLYLEVLRTRMRPFGDGVHRFPRMVRDLARTLGKKAHLEIIGESTQVDREILARLEAPITHLLRNAVDHGCEFPEERRQAGKPPEAVICLEARHSAGMLQVIVTDDGAGLDLERVRSVIVARKLTTLAVAEKMSNGELLQFLFLPGFTLKDAVTEISGRGVGLDVVQNMTRSVRGTVRVTTQPGQGMRFQLQLPLTLSVLRTLLVEIGGEPYAFPLAQIASTLKLSRSRVETLEGRHHFRLADQHVGLLAAHQVFECAEVLLPGNDLSIVVIGEHSTRFGLLVDRFIGERELVVQPLDPRLGKVKDISAAALMEDGAPVLIVDVDDMLRTIEKLVTTGALENVGRSALVAPVSPRKRVLVVDDSLTVRELERKLLEGAGYAAEVAVDGMDGWNAVRAGGFNLIITDVDMPRLDGIELATLIKQDTHLKSLPVMIVSYKDREEDRLRGLEAGADYYLTKGSFHDEKLLQAVVDLIGEAGA